MTILAVPAASVGSLRQRLVDDMTLRRFSRATQRNYIRDVGRLATFLRRSPDTATVDDLRRFQIAQQEVGLGVPTTNAIVSALRFFFVHTIERPDLARRLVRLNHPRPLPDVLSAEEVGRLLGAASATMTRIAADSKHLGARIGLTAVLHTWGSAMTHQPHLHMIVPGGGLSPDGTRWVASRPAFLLPVRVLGMLFRRLFLEGLTALHEAGTLAFFGTLAPLSDAKAFVRALAPVRGKRWVVYAKPPFAGPKAVVAYLSRYTHRVAISSRRILAFDGANVSFRVKDYQRAEGRQTRVMTLSATEFIRRFLLHVLPRGFHRIRHYGFLTGSNRKAGLAHIRTILGVPAPPPSTDPEPDTPGAASDVRAPCPCCGGPMRTVGAFAGWYQPRGPPFRPAPNRACTP